MLEQVLCGTHISLEGGVAFWHSAIPSANSVLEQAEATAVVTLVQQDLEILCIECSNGMF